MVPPRAAVLIALALLGPWPGPYRAAAQELTDATYAKWREYLLPKSEDLAYRQIAWRPSVWEAAAEAQAKEKPVLLWAMNGHPLCNT